MKIKSLRSPDQILLTLVVGGLAVVAGVLGWVKLNYGFNYIDEGMYMVDGWRLTVGDSLFPDSKVNVLMLFNVFNAMFFDLFPDITLLEFRRVQYLLCIVSLIVLVYGISKWFRVIWPVLIALALILFTGLDPIGMSSNMSYYTYPHFFLTLYIGTLLVALKKEPGLTRITLLLLSGGFLWAIGFSLLPLAVTMISPLVLYLFCKACSSAPKISFVDLVSMALPGVLLWLIFIGFHAADYFSALESMLGYLPGIQFYRKAIVLAYLLVNLVVYTSFLVAIRFLSGPMLIGICATLSVVTFFAIDTNLLETLQYYWRGWFIAPMWISSLMVVFLSHQLILNAVHCIKKTAGNEESPVMLIMLLPLVIYAVTFVVFSSMGILSVLLAGAPILACFSLYVYHELQRRETGVFNKICILLFFLGPFAYHTAMADWRFTYFDMPPAYLTETISEGFGKGIKTNKTFYLLYNWMRNKAEKFSAKKDFALIFDKVPMGYMIIKRRPSLNHSWSGYGHSHELRIDAIKQMKESNRFPAVAFMFVHMPMFYKESPKSRQFLIAGRNQYRRDDPIIVYIRENMRPAGGFALDDELWVQSYAKKQ